MPHSLISPQSEKYQMPSLKAQFREPGRLYHLESRLQAGQYFVKNILIKMIIANVLVK
ncbi:MAG: hypothetical protein ACJAZP_002320 [Psychromonas sp.]|jgi:hypothetical protein